MSAKYVEINMELNIPEIYENIFVS